MRTVGILLAMVLFIAPIGFSQESRAQEFENPPGWAWLIHPMGTSSSSWSSNGVLGENRETCAGGFELTVAFKKTEGSSYRAVAFDSEGGRHELKGYGGSSGDLTMMTYSAPLESLSYNEVAFAGIEVLSAEGWPVASDEAAKRARAAGITTLPLPQVGKTFEFELVGTNGVAVNSTSFAGKVVVIDCWATWCTPCMKKMPKLKQLSDRWADQGLEIIGVNFDQDQGKAFKTTTELDLNWNHIAVSPSAEVRKAWWGVSGISTLPRILVVNRSGVLVYDGRQIDEVESTLVELLGQPGSQ